MELVMNFNLKLGHFFKCLIAVIFCFIVGMALTYKPFNCDGVHATMSIETSTGVGKLYESVNGSQGHLSGEELALKNKVKLKLPKGESAVLHFVCPQCGFNLARKVEAPCCVIFKCDCPEDSKAHISTEYIAVDISTK